MKTERCKQCGAEIVWAGLSSDPWKRAPLDARPVRSDENVKHGNIHLDTLRLNYIVLEPEMVASARQRGFELYTNHLDTCPARDRSARETEYGRQEREIYEHAS